MDGVATLFRHPTVRWARAPCQRPSFHVSPNTCFPETGENPKAVDKGHITRLKLVKRQMFGRAKLDRRFTDQVRHRLCPVSPWDRDTAMVMSASATRVSCSYLSRCRLRSGAWYVCPIGCGLLRREQHFEMKNCDRLKSQGTTFVPGNCGGIGFT